MPLPDRILGQQARLGWPEQQRKNLCLTAKVSLASLTLTRWLRHDSPTGPGLALKQI